MSPCCLPVCFQSFGLWGDLAAPLINWGGEAKACEVIRKSKKETHLASLSAAFKETLWSALGRSHGQRGPQLPPSSVLGILH